MEETLLDYLRIQSKPVTKMDIRKAGFTRFNNELKKLVRDGFVKQTENFKSNTLKQYRDDVGKKYTYAGTRYYTYKAI